jgi:hypothetical protein
MVIWCCAADALFTQAHVTGIPDPGTDTWVQITGTWQPGPSPVPVIDAAHLWLCQPELAPEFSWCLAPPGGGCWG